MMSFMKHNNNLRVRKVSLRQGTCLAQFDTMARRIQFNTQNPGRTNYILGCNSITSTALPTFGYIKNEKRPSLSARACWLLVVFLCTVGCLIQIGDRVWTYFRTPVKLEISIERNSSITYPAITVCPDYNLRTEKINNLHIKHCKEHLDPPGDCYNQTVLQNTSYTKLNLTNDTVFLMEAVDPEDINATEPCFRRLTTKGKLGTPTSANKTKLWTYWGQCTVVIPAKPVQFRGTSTKVTLKLSRAAAKIMYHSQNVLHRHEAFFFAMSVRNKRETFLILGAKKFIFENTRENPCIGERESEICRSRCIDKILSENPEILCKIPPLRNRTIPQCKNQAEALASISALEQTYINMKADECICTRKCEEFIYTAAVEENINENENGIVLHVVYPDNVYELMREVYSYSFTALVSDIGGSLGFYLGVCVLQVFEFLQGLYHNFNPRQCSCNKQPRSCALN